MAAPVTLTRPWPEDADTIVAALSDWQVTQWLSVVPWPYAMTDAQAFIAEAGPDEHAVRQGDRLVAWRNNCPHYDNARMAWKKDEFLNADRDRIVCGAHGALFEIDSGVCVQGPCLGDKLIPVALDIRDGEVFLAAPYKHGMRPRPGRPHN